MAPDTHRAIMNRMVKDFGSDVGVIDPVRVLRLPGFHHMKNPASPHRVELVEANGRVYTADQIAAAFPPIWPSRLADKPSPAKPLPAVLEPELERARKALCFIPSDDRDTWLKVGMALSASFGESGRGLWDAWSRQSGKYTDAGQVKAWKSFKGASLTIGTIFWLRRQHRGRAPIYSL